MRAILFGILGVAGAVVLRSPGPWDPNLPLPFPTRKLEWGNVNVLHKTDIHGWVSGHSKNIYPEKIWSGNFGDFYSFVTHMRNIANQRNSDLLLVDTGDRRIGHALTDFILDPRDVNGQNVSLLYHRMKYDLVVPETNVVNWTMNTLVRVWGDRCLTSNVNRTDETVPEKRKPLGARYRRWTTPTGKRMMAFGVVPIKTRTPSELKVVPINDTVRHEWFQEAIKEEVDVFVVLVGLIYKAIRQKHKVIPILIFAGHTHKRWCKTFQEEENSTRSMLIQSGRYFDTVGWMSVKLDNNTVARNLTFSRRFLDNNIQTYKYHTGISDDAKFHTMVGRQMTKFIEGMEKSENLTHVYGKLELDYYLDRKEWTEDEKDKQSLFSFYLDAVETSLVDPRRSPNWLFFSNWGILRGDIYKGPFTLSDLYAISPDDQSPFLYTTVPRRIADQIVQKTREMEKDEKDNSKPKNSTNPPSGTPGTIKDQSQAVFSLPSRKSTGLTYGWVTEDECGSDGDDVAHVEIPKVDFDNPKSGLPVYFWRKNYRLEDLDLEDPVHIIVTNRIGTTRVPKALQQLGVVIKPNLATYREDVKQHNLLATYITYRFPSPGKNGTDNA